MAKAIGRSYTFDECYNYNIYKDYNVVDKFNINDLENIKQYSDLTFVNAIDVVADEMVGIGYFPTYCFYIEDRYITVYANEECLDEDKNYKYDRVEFINALEEELKKPIYQ